MADPLAKISSKRILATETAGTGGKLMEPMGRRKKIGGASSSFLLAQFLSDFNGSGQAMRSDKLSAS